MNKYLVAGLAVLAVLAGALGALGAVLIKTPVLGGDFAGGQLPSQLMTGSAAGGYVNPIGSLAIATPSGLYVGGTNLYNEQAVYETASGTPLSAGATLGPLGASTSTATTTITLPNTAGLALGAICSGGAATTTVMVSGCVLTATDNVTGTATVAFTNITGAAITVPSTTLLRIAFDQLPY